MRNGTAQKRKKRSLYVNRRNKKAKTALIVGFSALLLSVFFITKSLLAPMASAFSSASSDTFDKDIYSFLLVEKDQEDVVKTLNLILVQQSDNKLYSISIPVFLKMDLPGRLGEEEISKTLQIGRSVGYSGGENKLIVDSVAKLINLHVDRYLISSGDAFGIVQESLFNKQLGFLLPWQYRKLSQNIETDMSARETYQLAMFVRGLDTQGIESLNMTDFVDLNLKIRDITLSGDVAEESLGVVILNGTGVPDIARSASIPCQNMGIRVALTANAENKYQNSYLITNDASTATAKYLLDYFPELKVMDRAAASSTGEDTIERGDLTIILGFDIQDRLE